ncbi:hypothetical protein MKW94_012812 [Papaver nudicaule]|uniref:Uncharacterized protein n=1 Tax=Papaver nudicaule TaxID=74823 RepID=A0AA41S901_PAPNU|nr:hypothetical protein [Papaver nudicaule]
MAMVVIGKAFRLSIIIIAQNSTNEQLELYMNLTLFLNQIEVNDEHVVAFVQHNWHVSDDHISQQPSTEPAQPIIPGQAEGQLLSTDDLQKESKIALGLFSVSAASVMTVTSVLLGEQTFELKDLTVIRAYTSLSYVSLFSATIMFLLILYRPNIPCLLKAVRFTMCVSLGSFLYALASASSILLLGKLVGMILVIISLVLFVILNTLVCYIA